MTKKTAEDWDCEQVEWEEELKTFSAEELFEDLDSDLYGWHQACILREIQRRMETGISYDAIPRKKPIPKPAPPIDHENRLCSECGKKIDPEYSRKCSVFSQCEACEDNVGEVTCTWGVSVKYMVGAQPLFNPDDLPVMVGDKVRFGKDIKRLPGIRIKEIIERVKDPKTLRITQISPTFNLCFAEEDGQIVQLIRPMELDIHVNDEVAVHSIKSKFLSYDYGVREVVNGS